MAAGVLHGWEQQQGWVFQRGPELINHRLVRRVVYNDEQRGYMTSCTSPRPAKSPVKLKLKIHRYHTFPFFFSEKCERAGELGKAPNVM